MLPTLDGSGKMTQLEWKLASVKYPSVRFYRADCTYMQKPNAAVSMAAVLSDIVIDVRAVHPANAYSGIVLMRPPMTTVCSPVHP